MGAGMGHLLQLILLAGCALAGASAALSSQLLENSQDREEQGNARTLPLETSDDEWAAITRAPLTADVIKFANGTELPLFPEAADGRTFVMSDGTETGAAGARRSLGDFRQCAPCTCCDRTRRWCLPTVCCYNIRCGLQGLPYGLCSFIPISCTCFGCRD